MKIWGRRNSANVKKVLWAAEELGLPYEQIDAGGAFGIVSTPDYLARNPNGLVPLLEDGDLTLWESNTIVRYLAARYGAGTLWIADPGARAEAEKWMDWSHQFAAPFREVIFGLLRTPPEKRNLAAIEGGRVAVARLFGIADAALATTPWLSGPAFGIADIVLGPFAYVWMELAIERPDHPHLADWYRRLQTRPTWPTAVAIGLS
ncbi:glutathione S-transferase family protein [Siculibacillus lacustris]|uniref:Glutathione S-transferase family protein n=1 Tax=Siculibacillus lacustris TaxID=1549641 RepID=A0A4Q9VGY2_9HYPH|nr:glutathione S-transferase family protein [Siculibacillus lacustris]